MAQPVIFKLPRHKIVFIATAKAANSSLLFSLLNALSDEEKESYLISMREYVDSDGADDKPLIQTWFSKYVISREEAFGYKSDHFIFTIVRNPWDRVVSHYEDKVNGNKKLHTRLEGVDGFFYKMSFSDYLLVLEARFNEISDVHVMPQCNNFFYRGSFLPDYLMRFERIESDFTLLKSILFQLDLPLLDIPHENKSYRKSYQSMYKSKKEIDIVHRLYERDVKIFGYSYEQQ